MRLGSNSAAETFVVRSKRPTRKPEIVSSISTQNYPLLEPPSFQFHDHSGPDGLKYRSYQISRIRDGALDSTAQDTESDSDDPTNERARARAAIRAKFHGDSTEDIDSDSDRIAFSKRFRKRGARLRGSGNLTQTPELTPNSDVGGSEGEKLVPDESSPKPRVGDKEDGETATGESVSSLTPLDGLRDRIFKPVKYFDGIRELLFSTCQSSTLNLYAAQPPPLVYDAGRQPLPRFPKCPSQVNLHVAEPLSDSSVLEIYRRGIRLNTRTRVSAKRAAGNFGVPQRWC